MGISSGKESGLIRMIQNYLDKIKKQYDVICLRAVIYARYSSDNQRGESIDAQIRLIKEFAASNNIIVVEQYVDEAQSGKRDDRKQFQQMMSDSKLQNDWQLVLVHKLDRFARNRYDSATYRVALRKHRKYLISVTEQFDDSPESVILESVIEGMAEYYSKNLSREVMKGLTENALNGKFCGGVPPLGYDIQNSCYIINEFEAQAVSLIYQRFLEGKSYGAIISELNEYGYQTKRKAFFTKNSIYEILKNEKYVGTFVYNKTETRDEITGKRSRHRYKSDEDIIRVENVLPAIISKADFQKVQDILNNRKRAYTNHAKEIYLLTGKIKCGICGGSYVGSRRSNSIGVIYASYVCNIRQRSSGKRCDNSSISRNWLESIVLETIDAAIMKFDESCINDIYKAYLLDVNKTNLTEQNTVKTKITEVQRQIDRITDVITVANSTSLLEKLKSYELHREKLRKRLRTLQTTQQSADLTIVEMKQLLDEAKQMLKERSVPRLKELVNLIVKEIIVHKESVEIHLRFSNNILTNDFFEQKSTYQRNF